MGPDMSGRRRAWARGAWLAGIVVTGIVTIVGSGGGVGFLGPTCEQLPPGSCDPLPPTVAVVPARATVQVGGSVTFTARPNGFADPAYQWQRSADGGSTFVAIAGATGASYALVGANLGDDAAVFRVVARPRDASAPTAASSGLLVVSSAPGVVFADADFAPAGWQVSELAVPPDNGAAHTEERVADGGNPGAFRRMTHTMPPTQDALGVINLSTTAVYDPARSGAIRVIDYAEDCAILSAGHPWFMVWSNLVIEQAGRTYRPALVLPDSCGGGAWVAQREAASLAAADFEQFVGPACTAGEACPDFSVSAPPIRFGFVRFAQANTTPTVHGIDNWRVTVWRR